MKSYITAAAVFAVLLITVPAAPLILRGRDMPESSHTDNVEATEKKEKKKTDNSGDKSYKVLDITTGKVEEISVFDYTVGAVCAEMPATFSEEALKAQAVAARTYAERQKLKAQSSPDPELGGAYFSNDSSKYQAYFTENQAKQYYGENYDLSLIHISEPTRRP